MPSTYKMLHLWTAVFLLCWIKVSSVTLVSQNFSNPLNHMVINTRDGFLYIGAMNRIYQLDLSLNMTEETITGPKNDNPKCALPVRETQCGMKLSLTNNYNKVLLLNQENKLISCGSIFQGSCHVRNLQNISISTDINQPMAANQRNASTVAFITHKSGILYLATSYTRSDLLEDISIWRVFHKKNWKKLASIRYSDKFRKNVDLQYITGFSDSDYSYFLTVHSTDNFNESKIIQFCENDTDLNSFVDAPLHCHGKHGNYSILRAASIIHTTYSKYHFQKGLNKQNITLLMGVFSSATSRHSALCLFDMESVRQKILENIRQCFDGNRHQMNYPYFQGDYCVTAIKQDKQMTPEQYMCNIEPLPVYAKVIGHLPVESKAVLTFSNETLTSVAMTKSTSHIVVLAGTSNGHLKKIVLKNRTHARQYSKNIVLDEGNPVLADMQLDNNSEYIFVMTTEKVHKVKIQDCESRKSCQKCLADEDPFCGWCFLEDRCTFKSQCGKNFDQNQKERWLSGPANKCISIFDITPQSVSVTSVKKLILEMSTQLPNESTYHCVFIQLNTTTPASIHRRYVHCETPNIIKGGYTLGETSSLTVTLALHSSETAKMFVRKNFTFYDCSAFKWCTKCANSEFNCKWCIYDNKCFHSSNKNCSKNKTIYAKLSSEFPKSAQNCPRVDQPKKTLFHEGLPANFTIHGHNLPQRPNRYYCLFKYGDTKHKNKAISVNYRQISCTVPKEKLNKIDSKAIFNVSVSVIWEERTIESENGPEPLKIEFYRCDRVGADCGQCLSTYWRYPSMKCVWCSTGCENEVECSGKIMDSCPAPKITCVYPMSSPVRGGTNVTIEGQNLGIRFEDVKNVTLDGNACEPIKSQYKVSKRIVCKAGHSSSSQESQGYVKVKINDSWTSSTKYFFYKDPQVLKIIPNIGPMSGGSLITIMGRHLNTGMNIVAKIGSFDCHIQSLTVPTGSCGDQITNITSCEEKRCICKTSKNTRNTTKPLDFTMMFDDHRCNHKNFFRYLTDPVISRIHPLKSISSGGMNLTVTGQNFHAVKYPKMYISSGSTQLNKTKYENCVVLNNTTMICPTPPCPISLNHHITRRAVRSHQEQLAFLMDDVQTVQNLNRTHTSTKSVLHYFRDPVINPFSGIDRIKRLKAEVLIIDGKNLNLAARESDVIVRIGNERCNITTLSIHQLVCRPPAVQPPGEEGKDISLPAVVVIIGYKQFNVGYLEYDTGMSLPMNIIIGIATAGFIVVILISLTMITYWRKSTQAERRYKKMQIQLDNLESNVRNECKQAFAELQTDVTDLTSDLLPSGFPVWDYSQYTFKVLFPGVSDHPILHPHTERMAGRSPGMVFMETGLQQFHHLLNNKYFLLTFIRTLECQKGFSIRDKVNVASLLLIIYQNNMEYATDILKALLDELVEKSVASRHPKLMLRRTESVVEKLLTNWLSICLYKYLKEHAGPALFKLYKAIKLQVEKGPVDFVTGDARYSLSEDRLLREKIEPKTLSLSVEHSREIIQCKVLDCDTITQAKEKMVEALYKNTSYSQRPPVHDLDLEWYQDSNSHVTLQDEDSTTLYKDGWRKLNTLSHYKVSDGDNVALVRRQQSIKTINGNLDNSISSDSSSVPIMRIDSDSGTKIWHLVKLNDDVQVKDDSMKMISEIFLTRLLSTKGTLQKFVDDLFKTILTVDNALPPVVKYLFDYLDEAALQYNITDAEVVHTWKSNSLPLRFWVNIIKNPDFVYDINKPHIVDSCLSVIAQTFMDSCSTTEHRLGKDSPSNKLLYAKDIPNYKKLVERYYNDILEMPPVSDQDMNSYLTEVSQMPTGMFYVPSALVELYNYISKYNKEILLALDNEVLTHKQQLSHKLGQVIAMIEGQPKMAYL
ncbi:plexin-A2 isoform X1 [Octopus sinensis]|uniref:Plexin-A2 isoform X1 n=1 Tax=Octopus sinensis TaxID=2607531 RepID=A0A6P7T6M0_9MOLL|nr:plexin-A2 isoform X1 [Octopus sinensis]